MITDDDNRMVTAYGNPA